MSKKNDPDSNDAAGAAPSDETPSTSKQPVIPRDFEQKSKERFAKLSKPEITFEQYLEHQKDEFQRQKGLEIKQAATYKPTIGTITPCGNGDFEQKLDLTEWQGAYGIFPQPTPASSPPGRTINFGTLTGGIASGAITASASHQTWVGAGVDPNVGIPTTAQGSSGAVRIGNAVNGWGCELLSKTFVVTPAVSTITFWYAVVLQDPGHAVNQQPFFWVRVTDASGNIVPNAFDFGANLDTLIADTSPFFQRGKDAAGNFNGIVYKDWSCAQIDLSSQVGKQVTIEFVTGDCGQGGHWGYAYVDNFCGNCKGSPTGNIGYACETSTHCGPGRICFDYELPVAKDSHGNPVTGTVVITLGIYQNGNLLTTLTSPALNSGNSFCFNVTPASIPGINPALGGFDFVASGAFALTIGTITTNLGHIKVGTAPNGVTPGQNNDYQIACKTCAETKQEQDAYLSKQCSKKVNLLPRTSCHCPPGATQDKGDCKCHCIEVKFPEIKPCISVSWGDSQCDCIETDDVEVLCITVCNCYSNVTFTDLSIGHIQVTDMNGNPVPTLPDGTPSVRFIPSGPICFGDIGPCKGRGTPGCVSRELVLYTRGAIGKDYRLSLEGVCFTVIHHLQAEQCFIVKLCQD